MSGCLGSCSSGFIYPVSYSGIPLCVHFLHHRIYLPGVSRESPYPHFPVSVPFPFFTAHYQCCLLGTALPSEIESRAFLSIAAQVLKHLSLHPASRWLSVDRSYLLVVDVIGGLSTSHSPCNRLYFPKRSCNNNSSLLYSSRILPWNHQDVEFMFPSLEPGWVFVTSCANRCDKSEAKLEKATKHPPDSILGHVPPEP